MVSPCLSLSQVTEHAGTCWQDWCFIQPWPQDPEVTDPQTTWASQKGVVWPGEVSGPEAIAGHTLWHPQPAPEATLF